MLRVRHLVGLALVVLGLPSTPAAAAPPRALAAGELATTPPQTAQGRIFNGTRVSIAQVPWQVLVYSDTKTGTRHSLTICGGSIISPTQVVTAAHCVSDVVEAGRMGANPDGGGGLGVIAGVSDYRAAAALSSIPFLAGAPPLAATDDEQDGIAQSARIHPGWAADEAGDDPFPSGDVAVVTLAAALDLSGPDAKAIQLPPILAPVDGEPIPFTQTLTTAGFGLQSMDTDPDGYLYFAPQSVFDPSVCGALQVASAVNICAGTVNGTTCSGDSGSGLVTTDSPPVLVGLVSAGPYPCASGDATFYSSLVTPENRLFLDGSGAPPRAPRQLTAVVLGAPTALRPGAQINCSGGAFTGAPSVKWKVSDDTGRLVASGLGATFSYTVTPDDVGHALRCRAYASNAGGVAVSDPASTSSLVGAAPSPSTVDGGSRPVVPTTPPPVAARPVVETVTAARSVRRGKLLLVTVTATPLLGADTAIISVPKIGTSAHSRTAAYSSTKYPKSTDTAVAFKFRLRVPRHARPGTRKLPVKFFVYKLGLLQASLSTSVTVKIKR